MDWRTVGPEPGVLKQIKASPNKSQQTIGGWGIYQYLNCTGSHSFHSATMCLSFLIEMTVFTLIGYILINFVCHFVTINETPHFLKTFPNKSLSGGRERMGWDVKQMEEALSLHQHQTAATAKNRGFPLNYYQMYRNKSLSRTKVFS